MGKPMDKPALEAALRPLVELLAGLDLRDPKAAARLRALAPIDSPLVAGIRAIAEAGAKAGWLLPKQNGAVAFGRVAKDLDGFSVDAVRMSTPGPEHVHPNGEIDLCFALDGKPLFDGQPPGWVVFGPGSRHVPTVTGGTMLILYFLPGGAIEFLPC